jgi:hypothetical protein
MVAMEIGNERKIAQAAEMITAAPDEFDKMFNTPLPGPTGQSSGV